MSFILDALRKSEHARQRQTGPGLAEVPVAPAKSRTNVWATAAVALLVSCGTTAQGRPSNRVALMHREAVP